MNVDPAVRSVRVALALCERFAELLKGPTKVTATKQHGALFGVSGNEEELSMRIGEVQQIYPEIWSHLDDARKAFAARGVDVGAFDRIRAEEGVALGANVDVKHKQYGFAQYSADEVTKSANFNVAGHKRALAAADALMKATPDIDWAGIAKAESEDPNIKAFTSSTKTKRYIMFGLLALVIASPFIYVLNAQRQKRREIEERRDNWQAQPGPSISDADQATLDKLAPAAQKSVAAAQQAWATVTAPDALAAIKPGTAPCPYKFAAPSAGEAEKFVKFGSTDAAYFTTGAFVSAKAGEPVPDLVLANAARTANGIAARTASKTASSHDVKLLKDLPTHAVFLIVDKELEPLPEQGTTFKPGAVIGRAYAFSIADQKIVCAAAIDVKSTPALQTPPQDDQAKQMLFRDLELQLRQAIASGLRAI